MQPHTPSPKKQSTAPNQQKGNYSSPLNSTTTSPLTHQATPMSVLQPSHLTSASLVNWRSYLLSIITPALRFCFNVAYTTQLFLTLVLSFLLAHGLYATKALVINSYRASRIFFVNAWHTIVFMAINFFHATRIVSIKSLHVLCILTVFTWRNGKALSKHGWLAGSFAVKRGWKRTEKIRARIFFETMVWLMHPTPLALFVLWPGWILVFIGLWYYYYC